MPSTPPQPAATPYKDKPSFVRTYLIQLPLWALLILLVLSACGVVFLRFALPQLTSLQPQIESWLNKQANFTIEIGQLQGSMRQLYPRIEVQALKLSSQGQEFTHLNSAHLELDLLKSLKARRLIFSELQLEGLEAWLEEQASGNWLPRGWLETASNSASSDPKSSSSSKGSPAKNSVSSAAPKLAWLEQLLQQGELKFSGLSLHLAPYEEEAFSLNAHNLRYLKLAEGRQFSFDLAGKYSQAGAEYSSQSGSQLSNKQPRPAQLLLSLNGKKFNLQQAQLEAWLHLPRLDFQELQNIFPKSWQQKIANFELEQLEGSLELEAWLSSQQGKLDLDVQVRQLDLQQGLQEANWQLGLESLNLSWHSNWQQLHTWQASWQLKNLSANQQQVAPSLAGHLEKSNANMQFYATQLNLEPLVAAINSQPQTPIALVQFLQEFNPRGHLHNIQAGLSTEDFWLQANLKQVSVAAWKGAPSGAHLDGWLEVTPKGGQVIFASQPLGLGFPHLYSNNWLFSQAQGKVSWQLEADSIGVIGQNLSVVLPLAEAESEQGQEQTPNRAQVSGEFAYFFQPSSRRQNFYLNLGMLPAPVTSQEFLVPDLLLDTEVRAWLNQALVAGTSLGTGFIFAGDLQEQPKFELLSSFDKTEFKFQPDWPAVNNAQGYVHLNSAQVQGKVTSAKLGAAKLQATQFHTLNKNSHSPPQRLQLSTELNTPLSAFSWLTQHSPLQTIIPEPIQDWRYGGDFAGKLQLNLGLTAAAAEPEIDLAGQIEAGELYLSQINLPIRQIHGPLAFNLEQGFLSSGLSGQVLGGKARAQASRGQQNLLSWQAEVTAEGLKEYLALPLSFPLSGQTQVAGELSLEPLGKLHLNSNLAGLELTAPKPWHKSAEQILPLSFSADLRLASYPLQLRLDEIFSADLNYLNSSWQFEFASKLSSGSGSFGLEQKPQLQLDLAYVRWPKAQEDELKEAAEDTKAATTDILEFFNPQSLPSMQLQAQEVSYANIQLQQLQVHSQPTTQGVEFNPISLQVGASQLDAQVQWRFRNEQHSTYLQGQIHGQDLGVAVKALGNKKSPVQTKQHQMNFASNWPASPLGFQLTTAGAELELNLQQGRFKQVDNRLSGVANFFSIINLDTLAQRLKLDFSDVRSKGFSFESLTGSYNLEEGIVHLSEPTRVNSNAAKMRFSGQVNLLEESIDQELKLVLPVAQSMPLAATLVGAPQVGIAIWLTQKLFPNTIDSVSEATYSIQGSFDEPKVKLKSFF